MRVIVLTADGQVRIASPSRLEEFQKLVGGYIETVWIPPRAGREQAIVVVDEEGLLKQKQPNILVERLLTESVGPLDQRIVGDAFVCGKSDDDFSDVPEWVERWAEAQEVRRG